MRHLLLGITGVFGILLVGFLAWTVTLPRNSSPPASTPPPFATSTALPTARPAAPPTQTPTPVHLPVGLKARLWAASGSEWYLAHNVGDQNDYTKALEAHDTVGLQELVKNEQIFPVALGTSVLVLDYRDDVMRVRVLEGPSAGKAGWVGYEHVR